MSADVLPPRIVHLQGGLRAVDDRSGSTFVQIDRQLRFFKFPSPDYPNLYASLRALGLQVIGVEFVTRAGAIVAPDWWVASPVGGFRLEMERRAWCELRHQGIEDGRSEIVDASRRFTALVELLAIRILQMSNAYGDVFRSQLASSRDKPHMFDNTFVPYLEASIHAFLGDAATLRDFLAEFVWKFVLRQPEKVTSFKTFRSRAAASDNPIAERMIEEGRDGWIKKLSDLRNNIFHVAPIGANHIFPSCYCRNVQLAGGGGVMSMAYGLVARSPELQERVQAEIAAKNSSAIKRDMQRHKAELEKSDDALNYAWDVLGSLCALAEEARIASGPKGKMLHLTDDDIVDVKPAR